MLCIYQDIFKFSACRGFSVRLQNFRILHSMHVFHCLMLWLVSKRLLTTFLHLLILILVSVYHFLHHKLYIIMSYITISTSSNFTSQLLQTSSFTSQSLYHHRLHHNLCISIFFTVVVFFNHCVKSVQIRSFFWSVFGHFPHGELHATEWLNSFVWSNITVSERK